MRGGAKTQRRGDHVRASPSKRELRGRRQDSRRRGILRLLTTTATTTTTTTPPNLLCEKAAENTWKIYAKERDRERDGGRTRAKLQPNTQLPVLPARLVVLARPTGYAGQCEYCLTG